MLKLRCIAHLLLSTDGGMPTDSKIFPSPSEFRPERSLGMVRGWRTPRLTHQSLHLGLEEGQTPSGYIRCSVHRHARA
ncbi:hypothetical protein JB92DRAFT_3018115 [Gautieria morchelliformis]|nr:hypothetical protein JB92DRAFT_3018115 [Gautieria morchelliformis]